MVNVDDRLAAFSARFAERADEAAAAIEDLLTRDARAELAVQCHSLAGRAGMFGYAPIGEAARAVELAIDNGLGETEIAALAGNLLILLKTLGASQNG